MVAANQKKQASKGAANAQREGTRDALEEEQRQFDLELEEYRRNQALLEQQNEQIRQNMAPYIAAGQGALFEMMALSGVAIPSSPSVPQTFTVPPKYMTSEGGIVDSRKLISAPAAPTEPGKMGILSTTGTGAPVVLGKAAGPMGMVRDIAQKVVAPAVTDAFDQAAPLPVTPAPASPYAGMTGEEAQEAAIGRITQSPLLQELTRQGEEAILQQAAATGGLRGGNVQAALAQFRPQMLQQEIDKQLARLSGIAGAGQTALGQLPTQVSRGMPVSGAADYLSRMGDIEATRALTEAEATGEMIGSIGEGLGFGYGIHEERQR
jgi:hypothetical protein